MEEQDIFNKLVKKDTRKTWLKFIIVLAIAVLIPIENFSCLNNLNTFLHSRVQRRGAYRMCCNFWGETFICDIVWDCDFNNMEFTIPDSFNGKKLTSLGGYYGHGGGYCFSIQTDWFVGNGGYVITDEYSLTNEELSRAESYPEYQFTINIGKNVSEVALSYFGNHWLIDTVPQSEWRGEQLDHEVIGRICYYFNVDPDNKTFYSENGVVYWRDTGEPVEELMG